MRYIIKLIRILFLVCQYEENLIFSSIIENTIHSCRIKEKDLKLLFSKMIIYYMSSQLSSDEIEIIRGITVGRISKKLLTIEMITDRLVEVVT